MAEYTMKQENDRYVIYVDGNVLKTPRGNSVKTLYKDVADRILIDLNRYGMDFHSADSILAWHFTMIDNFAPMGHVGVEQVLISSFLKREDWTCRVHHGRKWGRAFGDWNDRQDKIMKWLQKATIMQMTAACCIGNAYNSINIALTLAEIMERYSGKDRAEAFDDLARLINNNSDYGPYQYLIQDFGTFELYYGVHLKENGKILEWISSESDGAEVEAEKKEKEKEEEEEEEEEELDVDNLSDHSVTVEQLVGRNYYHYTYFEKDEEQPAEYSLEDIELDESSNVENSVIFEDEEDEAGEEDEDDFNDEYDLENLLPEDCWVKRFVDDNDPNTCYMLYLVIDNEGKIGESGCIEETSQLMGGSSSFFMIPGMELPSVKSYDYNSYPPDKVLDDLRLLFAGRTLPLNYSFIQKRLPQKMIDMGGNGGSNTNYTYALQSAYRLAYNHMSVDTDVNGIIENLDYSSYQSSGSAYGDMFSRPISCSDRKDEAVDMLLYIYDMYTDEEIKTME